MVARHIAFAIALVLTVTPTVTAAQTGESDLPPNVKLRDVTLPTERNRISSSLQDDLTRMGFDAKIGDCSLVIDYIQDMPAGKDSSFGAMCNVNSARGSANLVMCDDRMVGKFTLTSSVINREQLGLFIERNCQPGG